MHRTRTAPSPPCRSLLLLLALLTVSKWTVVAQAVPPAAIVPTPTYDVVSIVPNKSDSGGIGIGGGDATFTATNADLKNLLINAFDIKPDLITGLPSWSTSAHWDVRAKISDPDLASLKKLTEEQRRAMLAQVLADRFHLKTHTETRPLPIYNLVVLPHGIKFKPSKTQDAAGSSVGNGEITLNATPISSLTYSLSGILHRSVIDQTNLPGRYDLHLTWAPDDPTHTAGQDNGQPADTGPSLFSAMQDQLGLKLVPAKGPVATLVIDHVDLPTSN